MCANSTSRVALSQSLFFFFFSLVLSTVICMNILGRRSAELRHFVCGPAHSPNLCSAPDVPFLTARSFFLFIYICIYFLLPPIHSFSSFLPRSPPTQTLCFSLCVQKKHRPSERVRRELPAVFDRSHCSAFVSRVNSLDLSLSLFSFWLIMADTWTPMDEWMRFSVTPGDVTAQCTF